MERVDKVPCVRHDMTKIEWNAVARILIAAMKVDCYLLSLSPTFLISTLFGGKELNDDIQMVLFKNIYHLRRRKPSKQYYVNLKMVMKNCSRC